MKHYNVVAAAVVNEQGEILCAQRGESRFSYTSLKYEFPGGKIEPGETPEEAIRRELREEMAYDVSVERPLCTVEHTYPDFAITLRVMLCHPLAAGPTLREHRTAQWLKPADLDKLDWAAADRKAVEAILRDGTLLQAHA